MKIIELNNKKVLVISDTHGKHRMLKIPYDLEEEIKVYPDVKKDGNTQIATSKFSFLNANGMGVTHDVIDVDKSFEGKGFIFPSAQYHEVYPFYTSDDYRITVSGNLRYKVWVGSLTLTSNYGILYTTKEKIWAIF